MIGKLDTLKIVGIAVYILNVLGGVSVGLVGNGSKLCACLVNDPVDGKAGELTLDSNAVNGKSTLVLALVNLANSLADKVLGYVKNNLAVGVVLTLVGGLVTLGLAGGLVALCNGSNSTVGKSNILVVIGNGLGNILAISILLGIGEGEGNVYNIICLGGTLCITLEYIGDNLAADSRLNLTGEAVLLGGRKAELKSAGLRRVHALGEHGDGLGGGNILAVLILLGVGLLEGYIVAVVKHVVCLNVYIILSDFLVCTRIGCKRSKDGVKHILVSVGEGATEAAILDYKSKKCLLKFCRIEFCILRKILLCVVERAAAKNGEKHNNHKRETDNSLFHTFSSY